MSADVAEPAVFANMCRIEFEDMLLVQERPGPNWPGIAFPGGHVEPGEPFVESVRREIKEETGLTVESPRLCGIKQFWTSDRARCVVLLFRADSFSGTLQSSDEGRVFWVKKEALPTLPLAKGFEKMLPVFENDALTELYFDEQEPDAEGRYL